MVRQPVKKAQKDFLASPAKGTRSQVRAQAMESPRKRAPQRCRKCPDAPLRSECPHSASGKRRALEVEAVAAALPETASPLDGLASMPESHLSPFIYSTPPRRVNSSAKLVTPRHAQSSEIMQTPSTSSISQFLDTSSSPIIHATSSPVIDPVLLEMDTPSLERISERSPSTSGTQKTPTFSRPNLANPFHDFVKGVYRGNEPHTIVRRKAKPQQIEQTVKSSKTFVENVNALVEKCEDISIKTGAWLFFGAQHPSARAAAINYASPRLRRDGGEDTNDLATSFMALINGVMASKRTDTIELQKKLDVERLENTRIRAELDEARLIAAQNESALAEARRILAGAQVTQ